MARPCEEGKYCMYQTYDWSEYTECCGIDFDGTNCPYIKPWGKKKYKHDHEEASMFEVANQPIIPCDYETDWI